MRFVLALLCLLFWFAPSLAADANVFVYHRFGDDRHPSTNISVEIFRHQLEFLRRERFSVLPLGEIAGRLRRGEPLPPRTVALTVDDAYESFLTGALPLLREYGYPATLFVSSGSVGTGGYLTWDQLRKLPSEGIEIGNHSASHAHLVERRPGESAEAWRLRIKADLQDAQAALERELGTRPELFAYPYGEYTPELQQVVREARFSAAVAQQSGPMATFSDPWALPRFPMGGPYATLEGFREKARMKALPLRVIAPQSPLVLKNPPLLEVEIEEGVVDMDRLSCFVDGQPGASIEREEGRLRVRAGRPLEGRRGKYTLTAPGKQGGWYWFSQLWIRPEKAEGGE